MFLFAGLGWLIYGLAIESIAAFIEMTEASDEAGHRLNGGIWYSLLAALLFSIAFAPLASAFTIMTYRNKDVSDAWIGQTYGLLAGIPMAIIWALLWLICLPFTWGLLPWGEWSINWWKIFPFGFGLIWMGGLPLVFVVINFFKKLANPEYKAEEIAGNMPTIEQEKEPIEIHSPPQQPSTPISPNDIVEEKVGKEIQPVLKQVPEEKKTNFWDSVQ